MTALAIKSDDFDQQRDTRKMLVERFCDGSLHKENCENYYQMASTICRHFESFVSRIDQELNDVQSDCFNMPEVDNEDLDSVEKYFELFEGFAGHLCNDFNDFKGKLYGVVPKENLPKQLRVRMNLLENRIEYLQSKIAQTEDDVTTILFSLATPEVLVSRAV